METTTNYIAPSWRVCSMTSLEGCYEINLSFSSLFSFCALCTTGQVPSPRHSTVAQTTAALTRLKPVWNDRSISLSSKTRLMRSIVTSIFLCACESWTLTAELQRRIQAMEMRCYRKILDISYKDHVTNEEVRAKRSSGQLNHTKTS